MSHARTLAQLGESVAADGPASHHLLVEQLAELVADIAPGAAAALTDPAAPVVVQQRALAVASAALLRQADRSTISTAVRASFRLAA